VNGLDDEIVAITVLPLVHVPPAEVSNKRDVPPSHNRVRPVIGPGDLRTVIVAVI
jgi:hypothetical protein